MRRSAMGEEDSDGFCGNPPGRQLGVKEQKPAFWVFFFERSVMVGFLLPVIYLSFISLGLPDMLLGSAWPVMHVSLHATVESAGNISMVISFCTIVSSLLADRLIHRFGTGRVTTFSVALTATALFGFSFSTSYLQLIFLAIPYGLGAGAVDSALNNYVALHYKARHMSWLHCMWGIGATLGPYIMGICLLQGDHWQAGYRTVGYLQVFLTILLVLSTPLWKKEKDKKETEKRQVLSLSQALALPGARAIFLSFLCYCSIEAATGLWISSYFHLVRGVAEADAAQFTSMAFLGVTLGRGISGFISEKLGDVAMIRLGEGLILGGILVVLLPLPVKLTLFGFLFVGLGCAPIYPSIIHSTPLRFGAHNSQSLVGMEMAFAYVGSTFAPKIFGLISDGTGMQIFPFYLLFFLVVMVVMTERCNRATGLYH